MSPNKSAKLLFGRIKNEYGAIQVSEEVVATITGSVVSECYGVMGMASRKLTDDLSEILGRDSLERGVLTEWLDEKLNIQVFIVVEYGTRISEVANNVIRQVHYSVSELTGLPVHEVKVVVRGVRVVNPKSV